MRAKYCGLILATALMVGCASGTNSEQKLETSATQTSQADSSAQNAASEAAEMTTAAKKATAAFSEDAIEKKGYLYSNSIGDTLYYYVVKNNSDTSVEIDGNAVAYDSSGKEIGASQGSIDILGGGETSIITFYFDSVKGVDNVKCNLSYDTKTFYQPVLSNINFEETVNDQNVTVVATNNGDTDALFVEAVALFFDKDNNVVASNSRYITDDDSKLKPGATLGVQVDPYADFDHVECYYSGRSDGGTSKPATDVSDSDFQIGEYLLDDGDYSNYYMTLKNNSTKTVRIFGNMIAYDASNKVLGAGSDSISVLAPGEESILCGYFDSVSGVDHVNYALEYNTSPNYESGLADLDIKQSVNKNNVVVTVKNDGTEATKFLEAHALFFDAAGKPVMHSSTYITDDDSELKPGATLSKQLDSYKDFQSVKVFFTGRRGGF